MGPGAGGVAEEAGLLERRRPMQERTSQVPTMHTLAPDQQSPLICLHFAQD